MATEKRLIDANVVLARLKTDIVLGECEKALLRNFVNNAPTVDAVEVVRCKDCKFFHDKGYCTKITGLTRIKPDDFCSYGERKDNGL